MYSRDKNTKPAYSNSMILYKYATQNWGKWDESGCGCTQGPTTPPLLAICYSFCLIHNSVSLVCIQSDLITGEASFHYKSHPKPLPLLTPTPNTLFDFLSSKLPVACNALTLYTGSCSTYNLDGMPLLANQPMPKSDYVREEVKALTMAPLALMPQLLVVLNSYF